MRTLPLRSQTPCLAHTEVRLTQPRGPHTAERPQGVAASKSICSRSLAIAALTLSCGMVRLTAQ